MRCNQFRDDMLEHRLKDRFAEGYDDFLSK